MGAVTRKRLIKAAILVCWMLAPVLTAVVAAFLAAAKARSGSGNAALPKMKNDCGALLMTPMRED